MVLFEFGCGYSTRFFSKYLRSVTSVEHDRSWYSRMKPDLPDNVNLLFVPYHPNADYCRTPQTVRNSFDVILVDGRDRVNCVKRSFHSLTDIGVIILDDSQRREYAEAFSFLEDRQFRHITFTGLRPTGFLEDSATIFYRDDNCLDI